MVTVGGHDLPSLDPLDIVRRIWAEFNTLGEPVVSASYKTELPAKCASPPWQDRARARGKGQRGQGAGLKAVLCPQNECTTRLVGIFFALF